MKAKMYRIEWIHPFQMAKIGSVISGVTGALLGLVGYLTYFVLLYSSVNPSNESSNQQMPEPEPFQIGGFILLFIIYVLAGFFIGYVGALVYNMVAPKLGGIEVKLKEKGM